MVKALKRCEWVQLEMSMQIPSVEKAHRRRVKRRAEALWDKMQRERKKNLEASVES